MKLALLLTTLVIVTSGRAMAQPCIDACRDTHCAAQANCQTSFETCMANAQGNPDAEAVCHQESETCQTAADNAFLGCLSPCEHSPLLEPCLTNCGNQFGYEYSTCGEVYSVCRQQGGTQEQCNMMYQSCLQGAQQRYRTCRLACPEECDVVQVVPMTWARVKSLYRE